MGFAQGEGRMKIVSQSCERARPMYYRAGFATEEEVLT